MGSIKKIVGLVLIISSVVSNAQQGPFGYYRDALMFGQSNSLYGSTARMQAIGGAQVALGGDISSAASNPAGLGFFNKSLFVVSPSLDFSTADSEFTIPDQGFSEGQNESFNNNFNIANIGTVINFSTGDYSNDKFKGGSLGISLSRSNSYHLEKSYSGTNDYNSIIDSFLAGAGQTLPADLIGLELGAYDQYLINPAYNGSGDFVGYDSFVLGYPIQSETVKETGSHYQLNIAWGGNYDDLFYFGGGMGVQMLNYKMERSYSESDFAVFDNAGNGTPDDFLNGISIVDELRVRGAGVNFNFGAIMRPIHFMTLGVNYTSPTFMSLDEEGFYDLSADWIAGTSITETDDEGIETTTDISNIDQYESDLFVSEYSLRTPSKLAVGAAFFVGKNGFITGDVEFNDYSSSNIKSVDFLESADNSVIKDIYTSTVNVKVGGEYRFDIFRLRAGYAIFPSPYKDSDLQERTNLTFGFGYRTSDYFLDFSVVNSERQALYSSYEVDSNQPIVSTEIKNTAVALTFGLTF